MDTGETSRKKGNEDETDRPLKKAKYLWQVKGKYHLKDNQNQAGNNKQAKSDCENKIEFESNKKTGAMGENNNVCNDRSCIEAILANSDKYMEFSLIDSPPSRKNIDKSISDEIPITLVKPNPKADDFYLRKWQARQIAKGFLDNTINRVLEHWMVAPFDAADFVENCDSGGQIEDEGILMAIQSHGLQSGMGMGVGLGLGVRPTSLFHCNTRNNWEAQANCTCSKTQTVAPSILHETLTPFHQRTQHYYEDKAPDFQTIITDTPAELIAAKIHGHDIEATNHSYDPLKMNDTDFLDAAVAVAIQKKGLTSLNCVDCG